MTDNALVQLELESWLAAVSDNYVEAYNEIVADQERKVIAAKPRSNAEQRKAAYTKAIHKMDKAQMASMAKTVKSFMPLAKKNSAITATAGPLSPEEAEDLMVEVLEVKRLIELANARREAVRQRVFSAITEGLAAQGEDFPEYAPGYIDIPNLGLKFTREGGSRKEPELDETKLEAIVGPEVWDRVTTVEYIPAQEVRSFNIDLFLQEARRKPKLLEELRKALVVGDFNPVRFHQRPMDPEE